MNGEAWVFTEYNFMQKTNTLPQTKKGNHHCYMAVAFLMRCCALNIKEI